MRREWIEIPGYQHDRSNAQTSPSMRREWIEICLPYDAYQFLTVSLHAEGVD